MAQTRADVYAEISMERNRQERLVRDGRFRHTLASTSLTNEVKVAVLGEEFGEVCRAVLQLRKYVNDTTAADLKTELIHVAAVAVAWLECLEGVPQR